MLRVYLLFCNVVMASLLHSLLRRMLTRNADWIWFAKARLSEKKTSWSECRSRRRSYRRKCKTRPRWFRRRRTILLPTRMLLFLSSNSRIHSPSSSSHSPSCSNKPHQWTLHRRKRRMTSKWMEYNSYRRWLNQNLWLKAKRVTVKSIMCPQLSLHRISSAMPLKFKRKMMSRRRHLPKARA